MRERQGGGLEKTVAFLWTGHVSCDSDWGQSP